MEILADENIPFVREAFSAFGEVTAVSGRDISPTLVRDADVLLVRTVTRVDRHLLEASSVSFVASPTSGFDHVDVDYLEARGIGFAYAPGSNANSVAEYVVAALLELEPRVGPLSGKSLGIVGCGHVGSRVSELGEALGMRCVLNDPPLERDTVDSRYSSIEDVLGCDVVSFHVPLTLDGPDATHHMVNEGFLRCMKPGAVFVNTSRGAVVDDDALKKVLVEGRLGGCVLDVWENEPNIDVELLERVDIGTPHIAGYSFDGKVKGLRQIYEQACAHFSVPRDWDSTAEVATHAPPAAANLHEALRQSYDIMADDKALRKLSDLSHRDQPAYFDQLRKNYPVRREYYALNAVAEDEYETMA